MGRSCVDMVLKDLNVIVRLKGDDRWVRCKLVYCYSSDV